MTKFRPDRRQQRHEDAVKRTEARKARTNEEQLALIEERPGESRKERKKLET